MRTRGSNSATNRSPARAGLVVTGVLPACLVVAACGGELIGDTAPSRRGTGGSGGTIATASGGRLASGGSPNASAAGSGGSPTPSEFAITPADFTRPWIRLSVPTGPLESVISLAADAQGFVALVRSAESVGKAMRTIAHRLAFSADGLNWSSRDFDSGQDLNHFQAVAFGDDQYVVVGDGGWNTSLLRVSSNGLDWTSVAAGGVGLGCAAHVGGRWVAGGMIGYLATSLDGVSWDTQKLAEGCINDVAFGNDVYVAAGNVAFWVSSDGQTWDQVSIMCDSPSGCPGVLPPDSTFPEPAVIAVDRIFFAQQRFFASGSNPLWYHFVSTDGRQWQVIPPGELGPDLHVGGQFLAISTDGVVQGSADAADWTLRTTLTEDDPDGRSCVSDRCFAWQKNIILVPNG